MRPQPEDASVAFAFCFFFLLSLYLLSICDPGILCSQVHQQSSLREFSMAERHAVLPKNR